jgi:hypothetical protein
MNKVQSCLITQSNYIPWKGYFDSISKVDVFVVYDDMQYTKRDWRNRNLIKTSQGLHWLSIPVNVSGKYFQKISETSVVDPKWPKSHLETIKQNYSKAAYFKEVWPWIEELYLTCDYKYLTEINMHFINAFMNFLSIETPVRYSSEFQLNEERTMRLVDICTEIGAKEYFSGPAAKAYMQEDFFKEKGIEVKYLNYSGYKEYNQLFPPFEHGISIIDLILNTGPTAKDFFSNGIR